MNNRERALAILNYQDYDRLPIVHFGFWSELLEKWRDEGHLTAEEITGIGDGNAKERAIADRLGFDFNWYTTFGASTALRPPFETKVLEELPDGSQKVLTSVGVIEIHKEGTYAFPPQVDHLLKGRKEWEELYLPKLQFSDERINWQALEALKDDSRRENPVGLHCGSLYGDIRGWLTLVGSAYLQADDESLFDEIIDTVGELCYRGVERILSSGARFDFGHFWEDIAFKNGPLINPRKFAQKVGPHYKRITDLLHRHGITICSLDCDGKIDLLIPTWIKNGVNTMFPIEVGTWDASIAPWRQQYGRELRGVGGMNKHAFGHDRAAIDAEIERLRPLVELGGFIPCPDHRIPLEAKWENVQYYCERMRRVFS
jgi:hypothetical protein